MTEQSTTDHHPTFDDTWDRLAEQGACDDRPSMEYERVRAEWDDLDEYHGPGGRIDPEEFIRFRANIGPDGHYMGEEQF